MIPFLKAEAGSSVCREPERPRSGNERKPSLWVAACEAQSPKALRGWVQVSLLLPRCIVLPYCLFPSAVSLSSIPSSPTGPLTPDYLSHGRPLACSTSVLYQSNIFYEFFTKYEIRNWWQLAIHVLYRPLYLKWITNKDLLYSTGELCSIFCNNS